MAQAKVKKSSTSSSKRRPTITPEARESRCISLAYDLAEQRLMDGTASSQEVTHFLKLATMKVKLENEKLELEKQLMVAKTEAIQSAKHVEELYADAIKAMRRYKGEDEAEDDEDIY